MLSVKEALGIILRQAPDPRVREVGVDEAMGKMLGEDLVCDADMPPFDRAMMDGFAVRSPGAGSLRVIEDLPAGRVSAREVVEGTCARIMTGAPVPSGADAVQQVEKARVEGDRVTLLEPVRSGQNVAPRGSDRKAGARVPFGEPGRRLGPPELGILAALGRTRVKVIDFRCAVLSTGDEVVPPDREPGPGQIRNSNGAALAAQVRALGLECDDLGIVGDDLGKLRERIREGRKRDLLLISGGVSAGDRDLVIPALEAEGVKILLHRVAIKPGKPVCFAPGVFGLPGNPVSSFVGFEVLVRPCIGAMINARLARPRVKARLEEAAGKAADRDLYRPASVRYEGDGFVARPVPWKGSADLFALAGANAFVVVPAGTAPAAGETVECMLMSERM